MQKPRWNPYIVMNKGGRNVASLRFADSLSVVYHNKCIGIFHNNISRQILRRARTTPQMDERWMHSHSSSGWRNVFKRTYTEEGVEIQCNIPVCNEADARNINDRPRRRHRRERKKRSKMRLKWWWSWVKSEKRHYGRLPRANGKYKSIAVEKRMAVIFRRQICLFYISAHTYSTHTHT